MDRPRGRRVLKFDGAFGPEGCSGGFAADFEAKGRGSAAGCIEGLCSLRSGGDSPSGLGLWIALTGNEFYNAACGGHVSIEYHNQDYHRPHRLRWMASHRIRGSRGSPMNPVRLHTLRHFVALFP